METYELTPLNRKSFYGKAKVTVHESGTHVLTSYDTDVASYNPEYVSAHVNGWYSATTARHINAFFAQWGLPKLTKKQMEDPQYLVDKHSPLYQS